MAKHLIIRGRVQGVGFRESMRREAARRGVGGWVRNRRDGSVEAVVDGDAAAVAAIIDWARRGPPGARVDDVQVADGEGRHFAFEVLPTL
jgi:acylphosphatase